MSSYRQLGNFNPLEAAAQSQLLPAPSAATIYFSSISTQDFFLSHPRRANERSRAIPVLPYGTGVLQLPTPLSNGDSYPME